MLEKDLIQLNRHGLIDSLVCTWFEVENPKFFIRNLCLYLDQIPEFVFKFQFLGFDLLDDCFLLELIKFSGFSL